MIDQLLQKKVSLLELKNSKLTNELKERVLSCEQLAERETDAQMEREQMLNALESQVHEFKKKQEAQQNLQKQNMDKAEKRIKEYILHIESQNAFSRQLQQKIKQVSKEFRSWKAVREKEVLQLEKEERRNKYEMHKLLALNQRRKMVLQTKTEKEGRRKEFEMHKLKMVLERKTEEAATARKRLKELLESKKSSCETYGGANSLRMQAMRASDGELEVTARAHELCSYYGRQMLECQVLDKEVICNEKEHTISELKEKVVLNNGIKQSETQVKDLSSKNTQSCGCSKSSQCKTIKCKCRGSGALCGAGCGCKASKCSNRDSSSKEKANQGAMPRQNAFSEKDAQDARPRKPLTGIIGNDAVNQTAETKKPRKNRRKSTVELIPG